MRDEKLNFAPVEFYIADVTDDRADKSASLHAFLKELGYRWEAHNPPLYRPTNFFGKSENIWGKSYISKNIVCYR